MFEITNAGWDRHCRRHSPIRDFGTFIHTCAEDPITRAVSAATLVLSLMQTSGLQVHPHPPGFLLINASEYSNDPLDEIVSLVAWGGEPKAREDTESFERNLQIMRVSLLQKPNQLARFELNAAAYASRLLEDPYTTALSKAFGATRMRRYAEAFHSEFGWAGYESSGHLVLRLYDEKDRMQLMHDLRERKRLIAYPSGYGASMDPELKKLSIAGSLPVSEWGTSEAESIVERALPVLFLPHMATGPLIIQSESNVYWLSIGASLIAEGRSACREATVCELNDDWTCRQVAQLRERLRWFPVDYEFFVMKTVRELITWCAYFASTIRCGVTSDKVRALVSDTYRMVLQSVCLGVEALGWHAYGFHHEGKRGALTRVLQLVRSCGTLTKRELSRRLQSVRAEQRDSILTSLEEAGLIRSEKNEVSALTFEQFWSRISGMSRQALPPRLWHSP